MRPLLDAKAAVGVAQRAIHGHGHEVRLGYMDVRLEVLPQCGCEMCTHATTLGWPVALALCAKRTPWHIRQVSLLAPYAPLCSLYPSPPQHLFTAIEAF